MSARVTDLIASAEAATRDQAIDTWCQGRDVAQLLADCAELDSFRRR